jgi:hypothetical protein
MFTKKNTPSSAAKAASGVMGKKTAKHVSKGQMKSGKGHFAAAAQRVARLRSKTLQHGVPRHMPVGASHIGGSGMSTPPAFGGVNATEGQTALNPKQQGHSFKHSQGKNS